MLLNDHPSAYDAFVLTGSALRMPGSLHPGGLNAKWQTPDAMGTEWLSSDLDVGRAFLDDPLTTTSPASQAVQPQPTSCGSTGAPARTSVATSRPC